MSIWKNKVLRKRITIFFTTLALIVSPIGDLVDIGKNLISTSEIPANNIHSQYNFHGNQQVEINNYAGSSAEKQSTNVPVDNTEVKLSRVDAPRKEPTASKKHKTVADTLAEANERIVFLLRKLRLATSDSVIADVMEELYVFATMNGKYCYIVDSICDYLDEHPALQLDVSRLNTELRRIVTMSKENDFANRAAYLQIIKKRAESR